MGRSRSLVLACLCISGFLAGCRDAPAFPEDREQAARQYVELLREQRWDELAEDVSPGVQSPAFQGELERMAAQFPAGQAPQSAKVVGWQSVHDEEQAGDSITLEYRFAQAPPVLATVTMQNLKDRWWITGLRVGPRVGGGEISDRFTLTDKGEPQYLVLALAVLSVCSSIYAFVACLRLPQSRSKWTWLVITLVGVGGFGVNWTTGELSMRLLYVHLPPAAAFSGGGPWFVFSSLPLGALLFLLSHAGRNGQAVPLHSTWESARDKVLDAVETRK